MPALDELNTGYLRKKVQQRNLDSKDWIPLLLEPSFRGDIEKLTYKEVAAIIRKCKAKATPCPPEQILVIALKGCPILRTYFHKLIVEIISTPNYRSSSSSTDEATESVIPGIKLPRTPAQWSKANVFFLLQYKLPPSLNNIDKFTITFQKMIYN
ncbi:hypothetical protein HELRODRAFT_176176 [Helobdella robusta]|uniref:Uncharacterized protein n=1 Tax=Helobdella robusta TaxID=6412 RepID=T1FA90_HELRO|nr:hypothetical protein HELRODRAFT_176176 [Helobdella robusta]ESO00305.1 hypothetical protein HELRODRAFT_176176 [Helobdella robusta]